MVVWNKISKTKESDKLSKDCSFAFILRNKATTSSASIQKLKGVAFKFKMNFKLGVLKNSEMFMYFLILQKNQSQK